MITQSDTECFHAGHLREFMSKYAEVLGGQQELAKKLRFSPQYISDVINGRREPSALLAKALGFTRIVTFVPRKS